MAFGFHGFEIGKQLGAAMGKPIDLTPSTNFLLRLAEQQKGEHLRMLEMTRNDLASYNPKGIAPVDIPDFYEKYNKYKELLISHPGILFNPAKYSRQQYELVQGARNELVGTLARDLDRNKMQGQIMRQVVSGDQRGIYLNPGASDYWNTVKNKPTSELGDQGIDEDRIFANPYSFSRQMQVLKEMDKASPRKNMEVPDAKDPLSVTLYSVPSSGYGKVFSDAANLYDVGMDENQRAGYQRQYESLTDNEKRALVKAVQDELEPVSGQDEGAKQAQGMELNNGRDLFIVNRLLDMPPVITGKGVNKVEAKKIQVRQQNIRLGQAAQHLDIAWRGVQERYGKDMQALAQSIYNKEVQVQSAANKTSASAIGGGKVVDMDKNWQDEHFTKALNEAIRIRTKQGLPVTSQEQFGKEDLNQ